MSFVCSLEPYTWSDGKAESGTEIDVDIHDFGRLQVVYASNVDRVAAYVSEREPMQKQDLWILVQAGV